MYLRDAVTNGTHLHEEGERAMRAQQVQNGITCTRARWILSRRNVALKTFTVRTPHFLKVTLCCPPAFYPSQGETQNTSPLTRTITAHMVLVGPGVVEMETSQPPPQGPYIDGDDGHGVRVEKSHKEASNMVVLPSVEMFS